MKKSYIPQRCRMYLTHSSDSFSLAIGKAPGLSILPGDCTHHNY